MLFAILFWLPCASASVPYINVGGYPWVTDVTPGLNWGTAVGCGQDFILNAYYAIGDAQYLGQAAFDSDVTWDGPFEEFFGSGWQDYSKYLDDIWGNINISTHYPWIGDSRGRFRPPYQLSVNCKETAQKPRCNVPGRNTNAYVLPQYGETGAQLTICPVLFDTSLRTGPPSIPPRPLYQVQKENPTTALGALVNYGQVLLHEFMHVTTFKHPSDPIMDLNASLPSCNPPGSTCEVYGHKRCSDFAHIGGIRTPNPKVLENADNYAWWATGVYFSKMGIYKPSNSKKLRLARADPPPDEGDVDTANIDADDDFVKNVDDIPEPNDVVVPGCSVDVSDPTQIKVECDGQGQFETATDPGPFNTVPASPTSRICLSRLEAIGIDCMETATPVLNPSPGSSVVTAGGGP